MFDRAVAASLHGDLHVGLPRAEPHLADEDILQHDGFAVAVAQGDAARLERDVYKRQTGTGRGSGPMPR